MKVCLEIANGKRYDVIRKFLAESRDIMRFVAISLLTICLAAIGLSTGWCSGGPANLEAAPEVKAGIIAIEGQLQSFNLRRVDGDPLPFYTYVPHDMEVEHFGEPEGTGVRFWLSRGGEDRRNDVFATIFVFPPGTTSEQTRQIIDDLMLRYEWERLERKYPQQVYPWSLYEIPFTASWYAPRPPKLGLGSIMVGQHGDLFFCVLFQCRQAFLDGFLPRYLRILEEFVWTDTNERLPQIKAKLQ